MLGANDIGLDLGTANVLVYVRGKGIVLQEPSVVALDNTSGKVIAVGAEAFRMLGRAPGGIEVIRPLQDGVIADFSVTEKMLRYFISAVDGGHKLLFRPRVMVCIPSTVTGVELRAVRQAVEQAGAKSAHLIKEPFAAALGAGLDVFQPSGSMIVDIGGGTSDVAVISLGGIVCSNSLKLGGDKLNRAIMKYIRREYNLAIGESTAEELKINIGSAYPMYERNDDTMEIRGLDMVAGLPRSAMVTRGQVYDAIKESLDLVVNAVKEVLERTSQELAADVINNGVILTGGGALLDGIDQLISEQTGLPVFVADDPITCVAKGTGIALTMINKLSLE